MRQLWQTRSNPLAWWWAFLALASSTNIALWFLLYSDTRAASSLGGEPGVQLMFALSATYVFGCAFRSFLPRADVQRICLFDTWLSSVFIGRSVATVAEVCFAAQWAILLIKLADMAGAETIGLLAYAIVPLIVVAQCLSWYGVLTTNCLANAFENSIWAAVFLFVGMALWQLAPEFAGEIRLALAIAMVGISFYVTFLVTIDVPMYWSRWRLGLAAGRSTLRPLEGLYDARTRWIVSHDFAQWRGEIAWMTLYFTAAVWASLALCFTYAAISHL